LLHGGTGPKVVAHFIERTTKACGRGHASEPTHRIIALFDATMILLESVIEIRIGPVPDIFAKDLSDGTWVGIMPIRRYPLWSMTDCLKSLLEKSFGGIHVSLLAQHGVNEVAIPIDGSIEVTPLPLDLYVRFIDMP
jgi:hypothetical protein